MLNKLIHFCLSNKLIVFIMMGFIIVWGIMVAPFDWDTGPIPRDHDSRLFGPVAVDAIPDIGENQQIVFCRWPGRSPQDIEDQISYNMTVSMLGIPGVKTVRSYSMFGFSTVYIIFKDNVDFYWSRSRVLEKLNSLPPNSLPPGVKPMLGPDATALGQIYWYTLEGRDPNTITKANPYGDPVGGWDLHELRSIQDWYVRYNLVSADGISEVASVGGFVQEYQIDVDPDAMRAYGVTLSQVFQAVKMSNLDVGARTIEVNNVEYVIRGRGFIKDVKDIENAVILEHDNVPIYISNVAHVSLGPALRRGVLDKGGAEAVGGVAVVRYGDNPLRAIKKLKEKIETIKPGLPEKAVIDFTTATREDVVAFADNHNFNAYDGSTLNQSDWLHWLKTHRAEERPDWLKYSKITIVPFYDRTGLIHETLDTLQTALTDQILVTIIVILIMVMHLRSSLVISFTLPLAVLICFIAMKVFQVDANIVALSGIAIAIGTIVDMGVIISENILKHLDERTEGDSILTIIYNATSEVGGAVVTAILTTVVSFLPVFTMIGAEGKLFRPLAFTKTFALFASVIVALTIVPALAHLFFSIPVGKGTRFYAWIESLSKYRAERVFRFVNIAIAVIVGIILTVHWLPLGPERSVFLNALAVMLPIFGLLGFFTYFEKVYPKILAWFLDHKLIFLSLPTAILILGAIIWSGLGKEFMPDLDEGSYLWMPTTMTHASIGEVGDVLKTQDMAFAAIPEVDTAVGKLGRAETPLDPAPVSMIETIINYKPEYILDEHGKRQRFTYDPDAVDYFRDAAGNPVKANDGFIYHVQGTFVRDKENHLIADDGGIPFRNWRRPLDPELNPGRTAWAGIRNPDDIWDAIVDAGRIVGTTSAPKLQPIAARIVMLQSGMRAPMGIKVKGPDLETIENVCLDLEKALKSGMVPGILTDAVIADRIVGKPYLEITIDRSAIARYGVSVKQVQEVIEIAIGGRKITDTVEGRERYPVRVRYLRELRTKVDDIKKILVPGRSGQQIPLSQLATIDYVKGPQMIKSEDSRLVGYVLLDKEDGYAEVDVVENAQRYLNKLQAEKTLIIPDRVDYEFAGNYENQIRATNTLKIVLPLALFIIFLILYFQFKKVLTTLLVFSGILVAWAGGFIMIWMYGQPWFLNVSMFGVDLRELFQIGNINLSVAVWVGFLALFGIASDDGVVMATYLQTSMKDGVHQTAAEVRQAVLEGATRRIRPCLMTTATTILALLPVLTSTGRGSDIMVPMAIPSFGGMLIELMTMFVVPVLYCIIQEFKLRK